MLACFIFWSIFVIIALVDHQEIHENTVHWL